LAAVCVDIAQGREPDLSGTPTGVGSAAIAFLVPGQTGVLAGITGTDDWPLDPEIVDYNVAAPGKHVQAAQDNNGYLAHAMVDNGEPGAAGESARALIDSLEGAYADAGAVR